MGGLSQTANQFGYPDSAGCQDLPVLVAGLATAPNE